MDEMALVKRLACFALLFAGLAAPPGTHTAHSANVNAAPCQIQTYTDSDFTDLETTFSDGAKVYVTVNDGVTTGGNKTITVTNNETPPEEITVEISDDGLYYDETADDGIYSGMFIVTTKLTLSPDRGPSPEYPDDGLCHKIVKNIHIDDQNTALIEADLDGDAIEENKSIGLVTLFNVEATAIKDTSVTIFWNTSDSGYSRVDYGLDSSYGQTVAQETNIKDLQLAHTVVLTDLAPGTTYHCQVTTRDTYGNSRSSGDYTFTTLTPEALDSAIRAARSSGDLPQTYYVKTDGDDYLNDGLSIDTAWQHPSYAVEQAEAGDTIYLIAGTWYDEHLVFANSGIDVAPITLTTYDGGMSILDGVDKTGFGIRLRGGKSYIEISGARLKNYYNAMYLQDQLDNITMHNFVVENTQRTGITFSGSEKMSNISFSNFEIYETGVDGGYAALSYGGATNFEDVEIYDFEIHDTYGSGVYWRYVDRLHVNDGIIHDVAGSDGVSFSLNTYNSVMENLTVHHADWHGVAVHDWTVGKNPCFNNVIRDCHISYASHNHIDLHSGAYNTLVENNTLHDELAYCTGIYFHNRGAGLIARDNEIYNVHNGVSGGGYDEFPLHDMFIQDNIIHDCDNGIDQGELDITVSGNHLYDNTNAYGVVHLRGSGMVIDDNDISGETYRIDYGDGVVRNARDVTYTIRSAYGSSVTLEYTGGRVYAQDLTYHSGPYSLSEPLWTPERSYSWMEATPGENGIVLAVTAYPMFIRPATSCLSITINSINQAEDVWDITANSPATENATTFTLETLNPDTAYNVKRDGILYDTSATDSDGTLVYVYDDTGNDWGPHTLVFETYDKSLAAQVTDLRVTNAVVGSGTLSGTLTATLRWTAPVNAVTYTLRYSDTLIAEDNWTSAVTITVPFTASTPGSAESLTAPVAYAGGTVYFALKAQNAVGGWSGISNNAFWPHWDVYLPLVLRAYGP